MGIGRKAKGRGQPDSWKVQKGWWSQN